MLKDVEPKILIQAIRQVYGGKFFVDPQIAKRVFGKVEQSAEDLYDHVMQLWYRNAGRRLTLREMDVLDCLVKGMSNREIGRSLYMSEKTVKTHLTSIFCKLHVQGRTQALIYALKYKLLLLD